MLAAARRARWVPRSVMFLLVLLTAVGCAGTPGVPTVTVQEAVAGCQTQLTTQIGVVGPIDASDTGGVSAMASALAACVTTFHGKDGIVCQVSDGVQWCSLPDAQPPENVNVNAYVVSTIPTG